MIAYEKSFFFFVCACVDHLWNFYKQNFREARERKMAASLFKGGNSRELSNVTNKSASLYSHYISIEDRNELWYYTSDVAVNFSGLWNRFVCCN